MRYQVSEFIWIICVNPSLKIIILMENDLILTNSKLPYLLEPVCIIILSFTLFVYEKLC